MKTILWSLVLFCEITGISLAVQSINQPFPELKLTDGRVLENARLKAFNSDSVFVRDDDGIVQVPYKLFPTELQPQLAKARGAATAPPVPVPARGGVSYSYTVIASPAASPTPTRKPPFPHETLGVANGSFVESVYFYDRYQEIFGQEPWVRVMQWGAKTDAGGVEWHTVAVFELEGKLWAWDINFGFLPLDAPLALKDDPARVAAPLLTKYPGSVPKNPDYCHEISPQQPEAHLPEVLSTHEVAAFRDATLVGAKLGAHRPVNVVQFSYVNENGETQQSATTVFIFDGRLFAYFPEHGTPSFITDNPTISNLRLLQRFFRRVYPNACSLKSLNYPQPEPVSAGGQN